MWHVMLVIWIAADKGSPITNFSYLYFYLDEHLFKKITRYVNKKPTEW